MIQLYIVTESKGIYRTTGYMRCSMVDLQPGIYRHFKGNRYRLLYMARHSETLEWVVVYQALYGDGGIWVRPAEQWLEIVERDGIRSQRFTWEAE